MSNNCVLTRYGKAVTSTPELKRELTVRPIENAMGIRPPSFKVYREGKSGCLYIPQHFGSPTRIDKRAEPVATHIRFTGMLRDATRQNEAFARGIEAFAQYGGGVLSLPPGFGKTTMALAFAAHLKVRTMIIVHKEFLANQWKERICQFCPGSTIGRIQQDVFDIEHDFVITMIQTMCSRTFDPKLFDSIGFVVVDEAHHIGAAAFSQTMFKLCPRFTLGLTATPERKDGLTRILYWFMGPEFFRVHRENQHTTQVDVVHFDDPLFHCEPPVMKNGKINMAGMITQLTELSARNEQIVNIIHSIPVTRKILILSDRRDHCFWFQKQFSDSAVYIGGMSESELFQAAQARIIIATYSMAQEGLDIPTLDTLVMVTPHSDIVQAVGRIMRETPGKRHFPLIIDIVDHWSVFYSMFRKRNHTYSTLGFRTAEELTKGKCLF